MGATNSIFTGSSAYSADLQNLISRATAIASLPVNQLTADKAKLTDQATALTGLDGKFKALQTAVEGIANALGGASFEAEVSDPSKVSVTLSDGAVEGNYAVDVVDAGAYATSLTASNWLAPTGAARTYRLELGGATYDLTPQNNSAAAVASAINSQYGDKVRATVVDVGSATASDYRISLHAVELGDLKPKLMAGPAAPAALQTQTATGSDTLASSQTAQTWDSNPALTFQLSLAGQTYALAPSDNTAQGLADAINAGYGDRVTASVVNLGDDITPDLRVVLTAAAPGDLRPDLLATDGVADPVSLQAQTATGSDTPAASRSTASWITDTGPTLAYQLSIGGAKYTLAPTDNSADAVASDINSKYGDKIHAAVVDLGNNSAHDYRLTLTALGPGDLKPDVIVSEVDLQQQQTTGALAHFVVNNSGKDVASSTRTVSIADGLTVKLLANCSGTPANITVTRPTSALSDALTAFKDAYNAAVDELDKQHGASAAALSGQSLVSDLSRTLSSLGSYSSTSGVGALANLGVELDSTGHLTFNQFELLKADLTSSTSVTSFLGSSTSGFLKAATDALASVEDPVSGLLPQTEALLKQNITDLTGTIDDHQARIDDMTASLQERMAAADALIASMQQQYDYMASMFSAMQNSASQYK
jgi:flagellar hook-associated protein 2